MSDDASLSPGSFVGPYRIDHELGAGGVGAVYAAEEPTIKKRVAIKVLKRVFADDPGTAARFAREARAANEVRHPNIVDVFAIGKLDDGRPYLVMSLLEGRSLRAEIADRKALPMKEAWRIAREVAEALAAAHEAGIVHRDLKPDNVFLERAPRDAQPRVRVLDFGIAKVEAREEGAEPMKITATGVPIGTPAYMAPEQWWCAAIDARTDQYAFGAMLFEMLAGRPPFTSQQFVELVQKHVGEAPPKLSDAGVEASPEIEAFVAKLLMKAKEDRFASTSEMISAGDAAFGAAPVDRRDDASRADVATAPTQLDTSRPLAAASPAHITPSREPRRGLVPIAARAYSKWLAFHAAAIALGGAMLFTIGYAGPDRWAPREWFKMGGWGNYPIVGFFLAGVVGLMFVARGRLRGRGGPARAFWFALAPALSGALATYTGWHAIMSHIDADAIEASSLRLFDQGTYEANACRFLGFACASVLFASVAAMPGLNGLAGATTTLSGALGVKRREAWAGALALAAIAIAAATLHAASGVFVAAMAALVVASQIALPTVHDKTAARDEVERGAAGLLAIALAAAWAFTRIEAREAVLWEEPTRADRVAEIIAAHGERVATTAIAGAALAIAIGLEVLRSVRLARFHAITRPRAGTAVLITAVALGVAGDVATHGLFHGTREDLAAKTAAHFSLFAHLDPPRGDALGDAPPHTATSLQVARDAVAVNGKGAARLAALASTDGAARVAADLNHALADAAALDTGGGDTDLSVSIDRDVRGKTIQRLFDIARASGVKRVEILLTRGEPPRLVPGAPPESGVVVPHDFVALRAELADDGAVLEADKTFGDIAPQLIARAVASRAPVPIRVAAPR